MSSARTIRRQPRPRPHRLRRLLQLPAPAPAPAPTPTPTPPPPPAQVGLSGLVIGTDGRVLSGATVLILDGVNAGRSVTTNSFGRYAVHRADPGQREPVRQGQRISREAERALYRRHGHARLRVDSRGATAGTGASGEARDQGGTRRGRSRLHRVPVHGGEQRRAQQLRVGFGTAKSSNNRPVQQQNYFSDGDYTITVSARTRDGRVITASTRLEIRL